MNNIDLRGLTVANTGLDILFSVGSNHSLVRTFPALFCFDMSYYECVSFSVI